jgi:hypothetical protein
MNRDPANGRPGDARPVSAQLDRIAESVWTKLVTRTLMIVGVPVIIWISNETLGEIARLAELMTEVRIDLRSHEVRLDQHERQLDDHEKEIGWIARGLPAAEPPRR